MLLIVTTRTGARMIDGRNDVKDSEDADGGGGSGHRVKLFRRRKTNLRRMVSGFMHFILNGMFMFRSTKQGSHLDKTFLVYTVPGHKLSCK